jgi:two-component system response regulator FixJ
MATMTDNAVVHLVDDDEDVRRALAFLLATAGLEVRVYESAAALLENFDTAQSGCVVSDVRMPGMDGIQLLRHLRKKGVTLPVIIMTGHADVALAVGAMKAGAVDFIEKPFSDDVLLAAIAAALKQQGNSGQSVSEAVMQVRSRLGTLSEREKQVLEGLLAGLPNKTIAYDLGISPRTVEVHRASVMKKLNATSLSQLVRMALLAGT